MSKILRINDQQQIEALHAFIDNALKTTSGHNPEILAAFIVNGIYDYAKHMMSLDLAGINNCPCSALEWQIIARKMCGQIEQYIVKPIEGIVKL